MFFHSHKNLYATYQVQHTTVSEKGNFIHKVPEMKQLKVLVWYYLQACLPDEGSQSSFLFPLHIVPKTACHLL